MDSIPKNFNVMVKFRKLNDSSGSSSGQENGLLGEPCTFKVDGQRFQTSSRTIKFSCDSKYRIHINVNPPIRLDWLRIAGSDCPLRVSTSIGGSVTPTTLGNASQHETSSKTASQYYWAEWDTAGLSPTQAGKRETINLTLQGPEATVSKTMQCKFYAKSNSHVGWGNALDGIIYKCGIDWQGTVVVTDEEFK